MSTPAMNTLAMSTLAAANAARPGPALAREPAAASVVLRLRDAFVAARLGRLLPVVAAEAADVMVVDAPPGPEAAGFEGAILVISDDARVAADPTLAGVLPASATDRQIVAAVAALAEGLTVRTPALREQPGFAAPEPGGRKLLTPREVEVLAAVGRGLSNKAIARRLGISAHTVKYHLEAIYAKLEVGSRAEAVTRGLRLGVTML
jgi:DNA-binding NarL/FixJ family response regulator